MNKSLIYYLSISKRDKPTIFPITLNLSIFPLQVRLCYNKHRWFADEKLDLEPRKQHLAVSKDSHYENINK